MAYRVVVGLPSFCEATTIAKVTADVDRAACCLPFSADVVLVNADNASPDGTSDVFLATPTAHAKHVITTEHRGKGANTLALLRFVREHGFDALISVDTDLAEVPAEWVQVLLGKVRAGMDFCYPLRPPRWNGADLTYHLAYPVLVAAWGADLREPLSGDLAMSESAARLVLDLPWAEDEVRFGGDFRIAALAATHAWCAVPLSTKRRNKLRSFSATEGHGYRMGAKFTDNAHALRRCVIQRLRTDPPAALHPTPAPAPTTSETVPHHDDDIDLLAESTAQRLQTTANAGVFASLPAELADRVHAHIGSVGQGLSWSLWRDCLIAWLRDPLVPTGMLEDLFLSRVVGHHREIAGCTDWYATVAAQARDLFTHRHELWGDP